MFASLAGDRTFSTTITNDRGLYRYNCLLFGVSAAPAIFQRTIETLLHGISNVCVYLDDIILVTSKTSKEHLENLGEALARLEMAGMRLKEQKCAFLLPKVKYLGHRITPEGQLPIHTKVKAITEVTAPTNISQLKAF